MASVPFSLRLDDSTRARLEDEARRLDRPASQIAQRAIVRYLDAQTALRMRIEAAEAEADAGAFVSAEAVHQWMDTWGTNHEIPLPTADIPPGKAG